MKYSPRFSYTFTPSSNTLNLSANVGFNIVGLLAVIDVTANTLIYATSTVGLGYSAISNNSLTLQYNCSALSSTDLLNFIYDDGLASSSVIGSPTQLSANPQIVSQNAPWGSLRTAEEPSELLIDTFDSTATLDNTNKWTYTGTAPVQSGGQVTISPGTTTSAYSYLLSRPTFGVSAQSFLAATNTIRIDTTITTNNYRFWGFGTLQASLSPTSTIYDGVGFEIDTSGNLNCVVWAAGTKTFSQNISRPTDGFFHRYTTYFRGSRVFWQLDNADVPIASVSFNTSSVSGPSASTLPIVQFSINSTTAPTVGGTASTSVTFIQNSATCADYGRNNLGISDGQFGWRIGSVTPKSAQGTYALSVQDLKDSGRNQANYYSNVPIVTTATDTLLSLTGYKGAAAVAATTTPAVVTTAKVYRLVSITLTYVAIATAGSAKFTLRANTAGVVALGSAAVQSWVVGGPAAAAGVSQTVNIDFGDGMEFAAGTGLGISMYGLSATQAAAAVGYGSVSMHGFEY